MIRFPRHPTLSLALALLPTLAAPGIVLAWGEPHLAITKAALDVLPPWQLTLLGEERARLAAEYCLIPDRVYTDKENARFAAMETRPGEVYVKSLHLPAQQPENLETLRYFMDRAVTAVRADRISDAARFMGTICHQIEDYGSPSHTLPGDNMFTLLQQFLPPSEKMQGQLMHGPIENGELTVVIKGHRPALLGTSVDEASWRLLHRIHEGILNARRTTIPILQALYAGDEPGARAHQTKAAIVDAQVVADALHTILCLGRERFETADRAALQSVAIGGFFPLEAENLHYPQSQFFSSPHWGHPRSGVSLAEGTRAVPLRLRVAGADGDEVKTFTNGISAGMGRSLTFLLPKNVYSRFTVLAGLHADLGTKGRVEFTITGDGKPLASAIVGGLEPARPLECDLADVARLQLTLAPRGLDAKGNHAIWADPRLRKP